MKKFIIILLAALLAVTASARTKKEPMMKPVYMFGFAASLLDSTAYQTTVQRIDSAWLDPHGLLVDRSLYSLQLQYHVELEEGRHNSTCTVFFNTSQRKLQRAYNRVRKRYQKAEGIRLLPLSADRFRFKAEEYRPIIMEEDTTAAAPKPKGSVPPPPPKKKK